MGDPVWLTAQEAKERILTLKIGGWLLFGIVILCGIWLILRWKYAEDRRKKEAENAKERIRVTKNLGHVMTLVMEQDGAWKEQYFILKRKYDVLEAHCQNLEQTLASAEAGKFIPKEIV
ncbi:MAG: hypothetical protein J6S14_12275 [Clostridia bacterium]|nr:hypothetical protein [Clostridia bacterium]